MPDTTRVIDIDSLEGPLGQRIYHALRSAILDLSFAPGEVLKKSALCDELGVSRSPVSDALSRLASEGLVDIIPQSATRVSRFSISELVEESFLREAIEVAAVCLVAEARTDQQLMRLSRNLRLQALLVEDEDRQGFFEADLAFHELILGFTGFPRVVAATNHVSLQLRRARVLILPEEKRPAEALAEHRVIFDWIEAGDPRMARAAMETHLRKLVERITPLEKVYPAYFRSV